MNSIQQIKNKYFSTFKKFNLVDVDVIDDVKLRIKNKLYQTASFFSDDQRVPTRS